MTHSFPNLASPRRSSSPRFITVIIFSHTVQAPTDQCVDLELGVCCRTAARGRNPSPSQPPARCARSRSVASARSCHVNRQTQLEYFLPCGKRIILPLIRRSISPRGLCSLVFPLDWHNRILHSPRPQPGRTDNWSGNAAKS